MATELDSDLDEEVGSVTDAGDLKQQAAAQYAEDQRYRNRLFAGAAGRVNAAENLIKSLEANRQLLESNRQMNESRAYSDAAKVIAGIATPDGPTESMSFLGSSEEISDQAARTRAARLQESADALKKSAESIYGAEEAVSSAMMEEAEVRKGASIFAEREVKMANFLQSMAGLRADKDNDIIDGDELWRQIKALVDMEPDPILRRQMYFAWRGNYDLYDQYYPEG